MEEKAWSFQGNCKMDTKSNVQWAKNFIKDKNEYKNIKSSYFRKNGLRI